ncbi:MAG TPA: TasA family protein [Geodermatophilus sp.]|nr:TasA family protein [Geodermatophilus sp.]
MSSKARTANARKIVGSLGVIGAAAAVAGLGTFGTFTDSTTPISAQVQSGTVSINLTQPSAVSLNVSGFVPGDTMSRAMTLTNDGTSALSSVNLAVAATASSILNTDTLNGLQLALKSCSVAWTQGGTETAPTYTCSGTERLVNSGAAVGNFPLTNATSVTPGGTDHLVVTVTLPSGAGNEFQGQSSTLSLTFSGTQRAGTNR